MKIKNFDSLGLVSQLEKGYPIIFPTDTLPALGILPKYAEKLWEIKKRALDKPFVLMSSNPDQLIDLVMPLAREDTSKIASKYWPGPLTIVAPSIGKEVGFLNRQENTIGMRVPNNYLAKNLLDQSGPLATTSANISGQPPILSAKKAYAEFPEVPLLGPIPWPEPSGLASTVISWKGLGNWRILRRGAVIPENI